MFQRLCDLILDDKHRIQHAAYAKRAGQDARSLHCRSSCASFSASQPGHQKPWRAKTRYQAFRCLLALSLLVFLSPLRLTHSVSSALSAGNQFLQCPTLAPGLILLSTCMIKEATRQSAAPEAASDGGVGGINQCGYLKGKMHDCFTQLCACGSRVASFGFCVTNSEFALDEIE